LESTLRRTRSQIVPSVPASPSTVEFRILGPPEIRLSGDQHPLRDFTQTKRVAVLAYLASSPRRVHRRDKLLALFWPDLDQQHARAALRKSVHHIRAALGDDVLKSYGNETLELDSGLLWCDAGAFEQAVGCGRLADALDLYRGDLLAGTFLADAPEFEHWLDGERAHLRQRAVVAARTLVGVAKESGDDSETARWTNRALELNPYDEKMIRQLIALLDRTGDYEGAISSYDALVRRLAADEGEPEDETRGLIEQVRANKATRSGQNGAAARVKTLLSADDCYAKGRRLFNEFGPTAFSAAEGWFNRAIELDPRHALSYSGLGSILAFRFIHRARREDLDKSVVLLQRALELDPDAVEPHAWLTYAYTRLDRFDEAAVAGARAIDADSKNPMAHFFYAFTFVAREGRRYELGGYASAVPHFRRALELDPTMFPSMGMFGQVCSLNGCYDEARILLDCGMAIEAAGRFRDVRFVGGLLMRAMLQLRENDIDTAHDMFLRATERYAEAEHVYCKVYTATAHCGLGEIAVRRGLYDDALASYGRALAVATANPEKLGMGYLAIRARLGLATAYNALRMRRDEEREWTEARELFDQRGEYDFGWFSDACDGWAAIDFARFHSRAGRPAEALAFVTKAASTGWNDERSLEIDECLTGFAGIAEFETLRAELRRRCSAFRSSLDESAIPASVRARAAGGS
jgi:DNA-binding SARP family transcriptional activator